ncbi:PE family protein, partial [Mycobacterium intermedium]
MSYVSVVPGAVGPAVSEIARIGTSLGAASAAAAAPTTGLIAAAEDEVSAAIAALFSEQARQFQAVNRQLAAFHEQFVMTLRGAGTAYAAAEAASVSPLQALEAAVLGVINAPTNFLLGRPLIGDGVNGVDGTGQNGGHGGLLWGNGGRGGSG